MNYTEFQWVLLGFTGVYLFFYWILLGLLVFLVLLGFTVFHWVYWLGFGSRGETRGQPLCQRPPVSAHTWRLDPLRKRIAFIFDCRFRGFFHSDEIFMTSSAVPGNLTTNTTTDEPADRYTQEYLLAKEKKGKRSFFFKFYATRSSGRRNRTLLIFWNGNGFKSGRLAPLAPGRDLIQPNPT